jgi:hypothetical protein
MQDDHIEAFIRRIKIARLSRQLEELLKMEATSLQDAVTNLKTNNNQLRDKVQQLNEMYTSIVN